MQWFTSAEDWKRQKAAGLRAFLINGLKFGLRVGLLAGVFLSLSPGRRGWNLSSFISDTLGFTCIVGLVFLLNAAVKWPLLRRKYPQV